MRREFSALIKSRRTLWVRSFYKGDPNVITWLACTHDHVSLSGCVMLAVWHITGRLTCPMATADNNTSLLNQSITGRSTVEKSAQTFRLASAGTLEFFGPQMALAYLLDAISQGPKNSPFPGPIPLPLAHVMHLPVSKTLRTGPYKS